MKKKKTFITQTLTINGQEMTFKFTKCSDGRYYYRPTEEEKELNPKLKELHKKRPADILSEIQAAFEFNDPKAKQNHLFNDELMAYLKAFKKKGTNPNKPTTYANVEYTAKQYIMPYFENLLIKEVGMAECSNMISTLLEKGYSKSIIDKAYLYTNNFLEYLVFEDVIPKNPLKRVPRPAPKRIAESRAALGKKEKKRRYLTDDEIVKIKNVIYNGYQVKQMSRSGKEFFQTRTFSQPEVYEFLLNTGLRAGELVALKYEHWDPQDKTINIHRERVSYIERDENFKGTVKTIETSPKNDASETVLRITDKANKLLEIMLSKEPEGYTGYIVHNNNFGPVTVHAFEERVARVIKAAGLEGVTPHDFRHTFASVLYEQSNGNVQYVKTKLRHKDATTTSNIYIDLRKDAEEELDKKISV